MILASDITNLGKQSNSNQATSCGQHRQQCICAL